MDRNLTAAASRAAGWRVFACAVLLVLAGAGRGWGQVGPAMSPTTRPAATTAPSGVAGEYLGTLQVGAVALRLGLKLEAGVGGAAAFKATLDSIDQRSIIPCDEVALRGDRLTLTFRRIDARFEGERSADGQAFAGTWTQRGGRLPLTFRRVEAVPRLSRPQEPKRPFPYEEEAVTVENKAAGVRLAGTLTRPRGAKGKVGAVLLLTGSGQQDRDEALMGHRPFLVLADYLTRHAGVAVLRLDDRGAGGSTGDFAAATQEDFVADARAAVAFLRRHPAIDPRRVGLLGHSEGSITAARVAAGNESHVAFVVMLAGVGVPMDELIVRQTRDLLRAAGAGAGLLDAMEAGQRDAFRVVKRGGDVAGMERELRAINERTLAALPPLQRLAAAAHRDPWERQLKLTLSPWFRNLLAYDPAATLAAVHCPVLAVGGDKDLQVAAKENLPAIQQALAAGGNRRVSVVELPGLNHLLQTCTTGTVDEYGRIEETMAPAALEAVGKWVNAQTASPAPPPPP